MKKKQNRVFALKGILSFISSPTMKAMVAVILILSCVWLYRIATEQFSPEVQRIRISGDSWDACQRIGIESSLYHQGIASMNGGGQYFDFQALVKPHEVISVQDTLLNEFKYRAGVSITSSGTSFKCLDYNDDDWHIDGPDLLMKEAVRITKVDNHKYALESRTNAEVKLLDIAIKGDNIFCESNSRNPYIAFHIDFGGMKLSEGGTGYMAFYYERDTTDMPSKPYQSPLNLITVYPKPDHISPTRIIYEGSIEDALKNGVFIIAEDLSKKKKQDVRSFVCSVLLGVLLSLFVQLIMDLLRAIRNKVGI